MTTQSPTLASQATAELPKPADRAPRLHRLKTDPEVYQAVLAGHKTFEIRLNDRDFRIGDELLLMETTATGEAIRAGAPLQFTGNEMRKHVSHVLSGYGLMPGWVCLSFAGVEAGRASRAQSEWISVEDRVPENRQVVLVNSTFWERPKVLAYEIQLLKDGPWERFIDNDTGRWYWYPERMHWHELPATLGETK